MTEHEEFSDNPDLVDVDELRTAVQDKYAAVATDPHGEFHFHTGRLIARRCRYDRRATDALPDHAIESFAGVANPFELRPLAAGERVVELGSGAGMDAFLAARAVGPGGQVVGIDMTPAMVAKARSSARSLGLDNVEFYHGHIEELHLPDGWADTIISNGVINLAPDKVTVFAEAFRVLRPGGHLQFADIANGRPVPAEAQRHIDLWTG